MSLKNLTIADLETQRALHKREIAIKESKAKLLPFVQFTMPDPNEIESTDSSHYESTPQGRLLCEIIERVEAGKLKRAAVSIGPQLGKSELLTRRGPAWMIGRNPRRNLMVGAYNQDFAEEFGGDVRDILDGTLYQQIFPEVSFRKGSSAKDYMVTAQGGKMSFVGVGASGTGKPADIFIVDDPIRNDDDAQSEVHRQKVWNWFTKVVFSRLHKDSAVIVVHTRWHEDDLIGRLCDPDHPERNKKYAGIAESWTYINLPAVITDPELAKVLDLTLEPPQDRKIVAQFGDKPMVALWENRKSLEFLAEARRLDARGFDALYMGKPAPEDGDYFKKDWLVEYDRGDLPKNLRKYGASDHATSEKKKNDANVLGCIGVDDKDHIWILPDIVWERMETDRVVEEMIAQMKMHRPLLWWMESELISKSFGPFLRKRMYETKTFSVVEPVLVHSDKRTRARSIQGRMAMRMVHFPRFAPWWVEARSQVLKFPYGTHDDFVDWLAHIGMGLTKEIHAEVPQEDNVLNFPAVGSIEWVKAASKHRERNDEARKAMAGW